VAATDWQNLVIDVISLLILGLISSNGYYKMRDDRRDRLFTGMLLCDLAILVLDAAGRILYGRPDTRLRVLCGPVTVLDLAVLTLCCYLWLLYALCWADESGRKSRRFRCLLPMLTEFALLAANGASGWLFRVDANGTFVRGEFYWLNFLVFLVYLLWATAVTVRAFRGSNEQRRGKLENIALFPAMPIGGAVAATLLPDISLFGPTIALSLLMIYLNVHRLRRDEEKMRAVQTDRELSEARMAIMRSQIQPHFLYNLLSVIVYYCDHDPALAKAITLEFTEYLRENLNSLKQTGPIPVEAELAHVRRYLYLEKQRFEELLNVEFDVQATGFLLPSMTVQPLVQNAVNHGLGSETGGGTVTVSTREYGDRFEVSVADDGAGFDPGDVAADDEHVGLENVRRRLAELSDGTLAIQSAIGRGTTATITIPKNAAAQAARAGKVGNTP